MNTINNLSGSLVNSNKDTNPNKASDAVSAKAASTKNTTDKVTLSGASDVQQIEKNLATSSEINMDKVNQVKQALSNGEYKVDADLIAKNFFDVEQALGKI